MAVSESLVENAIKSAEKYADDILSGRILACQWIQLMVKRHRQDLEVGHLRGLYFDKKAGAKIIAFFCTFLKFSKGRWAGQPFVPQPWQCFLLWCLFGWKKADGTRRFRRAYIQVARKNGKSELMAGICLYMMHAEGEHGAEVYSVATKRDQAQIIFKAAKEMLKKSPTLLKYLKPWKHQIEGIKLGGVMLALGSDADTLDGLGPSFVAVDEYHAHKNDLVYDVMWSAMGARDNPLLVIITTAGLNLTYPCYAMERDCKGVLEGRFEDDGLFISIFQLDEADTLSEDIVVDGKKITRFAWRNENLYIKANPNLGVSVKITDLVADADVAVRRLTKRREFLTKKCNIWYNAPDTWIKAEYWNAAYEPVPDSELEELDAYLGMDLAQSQDFCGVSLAIPYKDTVVIKNWCFIPEETVLERVSSGLSSLEDWIEKGYVIATEGNATDYAVIEDKIKELARIYKVNGIFYDPYNATQLVNRLSEDGFDNVFAVTQTPIHLGEASKEFEMGILKRTINHLRNPVLGWMANNVVVKSYPSGIFMVNKIKSFDKIDGISSSIMALKCYMEKHVFAKPEPKVEVW